MSKVKVEFLVGPMPPDATLEEVSAIVQEILHLDSLKGKDCNVVLNALQSAYWTAANVAGCAEQAALLMSQFGNTYSMQLYERRRLEHLALASRVEPAAQVH